MASTAFDRLLALLEEHESGETAGREAAASAAPFPYDEGALLLAKDAFPGLDPDPYLQALTGFGHAVRGEAARRGPDARSCLSALRVVLFEEAGFHGNRAAFDDVRNSYLHEVLDRRLGIPISLAVVMLGVTRRLGWPLIPVNFPGHFLVAWCDEGPPLAVDPFHGGLILGEDELAERWRLTTGQPPPPAREMLRPAAPRAVFVRMLNNIRIVHRAAGRYRAAAEATDRVALLVPSEPLHLRDGGYLWWAAGEVERASRYLEGYLERCPGAPEAARVAAHLRALRGDPAPGGSLELDA